MNKLEIQSILKNIVEVGTTLPPYYERFTAEQKKIFPPIYSAEALIARRALLKLIEQTNV